MNTQNAYRHCESVTRDAAANFYYGIRLLPGEKRRAMCAIYALARRIDDIADGELSIEEKRTTLDAAAAALERAHLPAGESAGQDPVMAALADSMIRFPLPTDALSELIEGVRMDLDGRQYERFEDLVLYCRRVAGGIGRLSVAIFGASDLERAWPLADDLGVAMQLTNILRDMREDAQIGRVYIPRQELTRFGLLAGEEDPTALVATVAALIAEGDGDGGGRELEALIRFQVRRAKAWFDRSEPLLELLDRRSRACVLAMSGIYQRLLVQIDQDPSRILRERVSLPAHEKLLLASKALVGVGA
ncbi:MAG TPA: squalene/phytoene synthase family protein [Solirubrobacteraceae bacterium]